MRKRGYERFFLDHISIIASVLATILLVFHIVWPNVIKIDATAVALLIIILLSPYLSLIKRIKIGEFEAEIDRSQVDKVENAVRSVQPQEETYLRQPSNLEDQLLQLAETDPAFALAKLRIEIERRLRSIAEINLASPQEREKISRSGVRQISRILLREEVINTKAFEALEEVTNILNKAVHGIKIEPSEAIRVIDTGFALLHYLDDVAGKIAEPKEIQKITTEEESRVRQQLYRITTIIPYVTEPERRIYVLTQEQLDAFLSGYDEYAEYIVRIEPASDQS